MDSDDDEFAPDLFARSKVAQGVSNRGKQLACEFEVDTDDSDNGGEVTGSDVTLGEGGTGDDTSDDETATARPAPAQPNQAPAPLLRGLGNLECGSRQHGRCLSQRGA